MEENVLIVDYRNLTFLQQKVIIIISIPRSKTGSNIPHALIKL